MCQECLSFHFHPDHPSFEEMMEAAAEKEDRKFRARRSSSSLDLEDLKGNLKDLQVQDAEEEESFFDEFEPSQDVYALNCTDIHPKIW